MIGDGVKWEVGIKNDCYVLRLGDKRAFVLFVEVGSLGRGGVLVVVFIGVFLLRFWCVY